MTEDLRPYEEVFFTHYQCSDFNSVDKAENLKITSLGIHANGKTELYEKGLEEDFIKEFARRISDLLNDGLTLVHWCQDSPSYGSDQINDRYKAITGEELCLKYVNEINIAEKLVFKYGDKYTPTKERLDYLATINGWQGVKKEEAGNLLFNANRVRLLSKIYFNELKGTLIVDNNPPQNTTKVDKLKDFLFTHGFNSLPKVSSLKNEAVGELIQKLIEKNTPYSIAMMHYLGFIDHLNLQYYNRKEKLFEVLGENLSVNKRAVKGNFNVLIKGSKEKKSTYTSWQHKEKVEKDYDQISTG
jgi:hypothetical protein